jgi:GNAT superfamily N-acetyltransferase
VIEIREATAADWPAMWAFMRGIIRAGETFSWDTDTDEASARSRWMNPPPGRTFVAVADDGTVLRHGRDGPEPRRSGGARRKRRVHGRPAPLGQGVGRRLGEHVLAQARADGYRAMQFNAVVECNTPAVTLWRALGFEVLATIPEGFRPPVEGDVGLLIMYRRL